MAGQVDRRGVPPVNAYAAMHGAASPGLWPICTHAPLSTRRMILTDNTDKIVDGFKQLPAAVVADVFRAMGYRQQVMNSTILPIRDDWKVCGRAHTHANVPARGDEVDAYNIYRKSESKVEPGEVIVESYWGAYGLNWAIGARRRGAVGVVIDGSYRDIPPHMELISDFSVFCRRGLPDRRSTSPGGSHRSYPTRWMYAYNVPINCGGVRVDGGDIITGDADGVVVVPKDLGETVLKFATYRQDLDEAVTQAKLSGIGEEEADAAFNRFAKESGLLDWLAARGAGGPSF